MATKLVWPLAGGRERWPITSTSQDHIARGQEAAIDIAANTGTQLLAVHDGLVVYAGYLGDCGIAVDLTFKDGDTEYVIRYCHLDSIEVDVPDPVIAGQVIGHTGSTGLSTGPHLHLAIWRGGERVRPEDYLTEAPMVRSVDQQWCIDVLATWVREMREGLNLDRLSMAPAELESVREQLEMEWPERVP